MPSRQAYELYSFKIIKRSIISVKTVHTFQTAQMKGEKENFINLLEGKKGKWEIRRNKQRINGKLPDDN